jgi:multimeric flavodoxin WrbA
MTKSDSHAPAGTSTVSVAVAFHSAAGHTRRMAEAVADGAASLPGAPTRVTLVALDALGDPRARDETPARDDTHGGDDHAPADTPAPGDAGWAALDAADAIVFGAPTHMGAPSAPFAAFAAATQSRWLEDRWRDKVAAGFTNSGTIAGDKLNSLQTFAILAAQHGMVWVGLDLKAGWATSDGSPDELNRLGSWLGAMGHSPLDLGPELAPRDSDLRTAAHLGRRVARIARELRLGRAVAEAPRATRDAGAPDRARTPDPAGAPSRTRAADATTPSTTSAAR